MKRLAVMEARGLLVRSGEDHLVDTHAVLSDVGQLLQALDGGGLGDQVSSALDLLGSIDRFDDDVEGLSDFVNSEGAQNLLNGLDVLDAINNNEWGAVLGDSAQLLLSLGGNFSGDRLSAIGNFADFYDSINSDNWASALQSGAGLYNQFNPDGQIGNGQLGSALSTLSLYESIEAGNWSGALHSGTNLYNSINDSNVGGAGSPLGQQIAWANLVLALDEGDPESIANAGYQVANQYGYGGASGAGAVAAVTAALNEDEFGVALAALNAIPVYGQIIYLAVSTLRTLANNNSDVHEYTLLDEFEGGIYP